MRNVPEQIPITLRVSLEPAEAERILVRFLKDYLSDSERDGYVVGVSGGIDSTVSAALACRAVGKERVYGLILPDAETSAAEAEDARLVVKWLGIDSRVTNIRPGVDAIVSAAGEMDRVGLGNVKARVRMILLHSEAARRRCLVLGTGNKSEALTGYYSKFGDGGVDLQPMGDLYKTQVRILAKHLGVPDKILQKVPTAGLWAGQTDEGELGVAYDRLDRILLGLELKMPTEKISQAAGVPVSEIERIEDMRRRSQHKRRTPMIPKIGLRTVGLDWRTPTLER